MSVPQGNPTKRDAGDGTEAGFARESARCRAQEVALEGSGDGMWPGVEKVWNRA